MTGHCGVDDRTGAWSQTYVLVKLAQAVQGVGQIERGLIDRCVTERLCELEGQPANGFFAVFDDDLKSADLKRLRGAAESDRTARLGLQAERGKFKRVRHGDGLVVAGGLKQGDVREAFAQAAFKPRHLADDAFGCSTGDDGFDCRVPTPQIRAAQCANA